MMLSVMVVGAGAAFSDQSKIKNTEAVDACTALNIIGGYPDGSFKPEGNITRAEVTKMICVALNGGKEPNLATNATPTFSDVRTNANSAWAEKYIESCASQGIVSGVGGGKFAPAGNVTGTQLAKMLLVSLGYKSENEGFTGNAWATNVNTIASAKGLYEGLEKLDVSAALTRDSAARMIWNALQAYEVEYNTSLIAGPDGKLATQITVQDKVVGSTNDKITLLRDKYDAWMDVGTLVSVDNKEITIAMSEADAAASDYVISTTTSKVTTYSNVSFTKLDKDYSELMGQKVKVIFKNGKTNDVLGVYATSDNVIYKTVANALEKDGNNKVKIDGKSYSVEYTRTLDAKTDGKTGLATYRDGEEVNSVDVAALDNMNTSADNVVLVDSDNNGKIDIVYFQTVNVAKVTYASSTQLVAGGTTYKYADDNIAKDLAKDDWVVITKDLYNDCNNIVLVKKVEATIAGTRDKPGYKQYRVDGTWYNTADNKALDAKAGNKASVVTYNGIIFFADKLSNSSTSADIAMLVDTGSFNQVKLAFFDGTSKTVTVDDDGIVPTAANKGTVYVYEINGDEYKLSALNKENLDNDDYTVMQDVALKDGNDALDDSTHTKADGVYSSNDGTRAIADSAKVLLYSTGKNSSKLITGKQLKSLTYKDTAASPAWTAIEATAALSEKVDGLTKASIIAVKVTGNTPDDYQTNDNYAVVVSDSFKYNSDYVSFDVFTGTETVTVLQKKSGATYQKGNVIGYSSITEKKVGDETAKVIEDVTCYTEGDNAEAGANVANKYRIGAIQGVNAKGDQITVNGKDTFKITSDTKVLFVNSDAENGKDDYAGVAGNTVSTSNEADEIADTGMYFYNCAYILDGGYTKNGDSDLAVLVIDVKNRLANSKETVQTVTLTGVSATLNGKTFATGSKLGKGQPLVVTATKAGTLKLTGAVYSDGTHADKANVSVGDTFEVYGSGSGAITIAISNS